MANLTIPADLLARLRDSRRLGDASPLSDDEREHLALHLEWLAAEVREQPVREASWSQDREIDYEDTGSPYATMRSPLAVGPWKVTVGVQFGMRAKR